jgi:hypothetical protein
MYLIYHYHCSYGEIANASVHENRNVLFAIQGSSNLAGNIDGILTD